MKVECGKESTQKYCREPEWVVFSVFKLKGCRSDKGEFEMRELGYCVDLVVTQNR